MADKAPPDIAPPCVRTSVIRRASSDREPPTAALNNYLNNASSSTTTPTNNFNTNDDLINMATMRSSQTDSQEHQALVTSLDLYASGASGILTPKKKRKAIEKSPEERTPVDNLRLYVRENEPVLKKEISQDNEAISSLKERLKVAKAHKRGFQHRSIEPINLHLEKYDTDLETLKKIADDIEMDKTKQKGKAYIEALQAVVKHQKGYISHLHTLVLEEESKYHRDLGSQAFNNMWTFK